MQWLSRGLVDTLVAESSDFCLSTCAGKQGGPWPHWRSWGDWLGRSPRTSWTTRAPRAPRASRTRTCRGVCEYRLLPSPRKPSLQPRAPLGAPHGLALSPALCLSPAWMVPPGGTGGSGGAATQLHRWSCQGPCPVRAGERLLQATP